MIVRKKTTIIFFMVDFVGKLKSNYEQTKYFSGNFKFNDMNSFLDYYFQLHSFIRSIDSCANAVGNLDAKLGALVDTISKINAIAAPKMTNEYLNNLALHEQSAKLENFQAEEHRTSTKERFAVKDHDSDSDTKNQVTETLTSLGKIAGSGLSLYETFGKLTPAMEKARAGIGLLNGTLDAFSGMEALGSAGGIATGTAAAAEIMAGAEGIATAAAPFGPPGLLIGGGLLLAGGIAAANIKDDKRQLTASDMDRLFLEGEKDEDFQKLLAVYKPTNRLSWNEMIKINNSELYENNRLKKLEQWQKETHLDMSYLAGNKYLPKKGPTTQEKIDYEDFTKLIFGRGVHTKDQNDAIKLFDDLDKIDKVLALDKSSRTAKWAKKQSDEIQRQFNLAHPDLVFHVPTDQEITNARLRELGLPQEPNERKPQKSNANTAAHFHSSPVNQAGKSVTINLNKPMIEHFTINAKEVKEGLNDLKRRVEEILLEILNSANAIH